MSIRLSDARALATGLDRLTAWLRRQTPTEVSSSTITALDRLRTEGPLRVTELAAREAITQPGVTVLVNRLAEAGWVERLADPTDRRATLVRITTEGEAVLLDRHVKRAEILRTHLAELDESDLRALQAALPAIERLVAGQNATTDQSRKK